MSKFKNPFTKRKLHQAYWEKLSREDKLMILKSFTQVYGGDIDDELEDLVKTQFFKGNISTTFMDTILRFSKEPGEFIMTAEFAR